MFQDRISRATMIQSLFGMSAPSVKIAGPFQESCLHAERGGKSNEPQFTRIGYSPALTPSTNDFSSAAEVLECAYLAPIPASQNAHASSPTWERLMRKTEVDFQLSAPRDLERVVVQAGELPHLICRARPVQPTNSTARC